MSGHVVRVRRPDPLCSQLNCVTMRLVLRVVCLITALVVSTRASAQPAPPDATEADRLFEEGRTHAKAKRYVEACDLFERSFKLDPTVGTELNLADCHEQLGHLRQAWQLFTAAAEQSARSTDEKRTKFARERADAVAARLATIVVKVAQPNVVGMTITIAGRSATLAAELRERLDPGDVEIVATVPGHPPFRKTVKAAGGATVVIDVPAFTVAVAPPRPEPGPRRGRGRVRLAWGLAGAGGVTAIAATLFTLKGRNDYNTAADGMDCMRVTGGITCNASGDRAIADAQRLADVGTVFAIGTGLLLAGSAAIYFTAPDEPVVMPMATARSVGVAVSGSF